MPKQKITLTLKYLSILSAARFGCVWGALVQGLLLSVVLGPLGALSWLTRILSPRPAVAASVWELISHIVTILIWAGVSGLFSAIGFMIAALFFNIVSWLSGGLKFEFERDIVRRSAVQTQQSETPSYTSEEPEPAWAAYERQQPAELRNRSSDDQRLRVLWGDHRAERPRRHWYSFLWKQKEIYRGENPEQ